MFLLEQDQAFQDNYKNLLKAMGALSGLFSDRPEPYIPSRAAENIFCLAFNAENHSRSDTSVDASKGGIGIGIKTFLFNNGNSLQKIAEFNSDSSVINTLTKTDKVNKIAELRNERLEFAKRNHILNSLIYHCVTRDRGKILVFEEPLSIINVGAINKITEKKSTVTFNDDANEYSYNISKSTLYKRFKLNNPVLEFSVRIIGNPFNTIENIINSGAIFQEIRSIPHIFLPLYSTAGKNKIVPERSALNQWNANGRKRSINEAYIPIPALIKKVFPAFFPDKSKYFNLILPNNKILQASVCQDGEKAIMSNPNSALGNWLLRDVMNLNEGELLTYQRLELLGIDSVVIYKIDSTTYDIDFTKIGSFENFKNQYLGNVQIAEDSQDL